MTVPADIMAAQNKLTETVMEIPGVVGTAIGECDGKACIKVLVVSRTKELSRLIPEEFEGHRVILEETGVVRAREVP